MPSDKDSQNHAGHEPSVLPAVGFIGTGAISAAMVTGLSRQREIAPAITVSPRNRETAGALATQFENVVVAESNQEIVDNSGIVILAVPVAIASQVLASLSFSADQQVISVVSGFSLPALQNGIAPAISACLAVPLPSVARNNDPPLCILLIPWPWLSLQDWGMFYRSTTQRNFRPYALSRE